MQQPRDFSLYGAVDLGARKAASERPQQASQAGGPGRPGSPDGGHVFDVTDATFETDVIERSRTVPVVMDLWAEWCGPCKQLSPILEKLATEANGAWVLAKVDVDANPQLSAALQVQSIPMVVAVVGGQLVPGFLGALPEAQVRQWLGQLMQVAQQLGMPSAADAGDTDQRAASADPGQAGPGMGPQAQDETAGGLRDPGLIEAQEAMERGDLDGAAAAFERMLEGDPGHPVAAQGLAQVNLFRRVNSYDEAAARRAAASGPDDVEAQLKVADLDLANGRIDEAFDRLLGVIRRTSGEERDQARRHLIGLFDIFPPGDPRVAKARSTLSTLLF